jgi:tetratricopeptide (TPR) repeat protein
VPEKELPFGSVYEDGRKRLLAEIAANALAVEPRLELAQLAYVSGDFETAEKQLREAENIQPDNPRIHIRLGDVLTEKGLHEEALARYRTAEKLSSGSGIEPEAKLERELAEREFDVVFAPLAAAEAAGTANSTNAAELNQLGGLYLAAGRLQDAGAMFSKAVGVDESSVQAALNLGFIQGLAVLEPARLKRSVKELTNAGERFLNEPRLQLHLAELYETSSLYDAAIQRIMRALYASKECIEAYDLAARYALLGGGREAPLEKRIEEIVSGAEEELKASPEDAAKKRLLAMALVGRHRYRSSSSSGDPTKGKADLTRASELLEEVSDEDEEATVRLAECRERFGRVDDAERLLRDAALRSPGSYRPLFELAGLRLRRGEPDDAVEMLAKAVAVAPEEAIVYQSLRFALSSARKLRLAELAAQKELANDPKSVDAHLRLGRAYLDALRVGAAIDILQKAADLASDRPDVHVTLGRALARNEQADEAEHCFRTAISIDPTYAEAQKGLGNLLVDRPGRMRDGLEALEQYRRLKASGGKG